MIAGIIAAGLGERLLARGIRTPKPLVEIAGRPLIARTIDALYAAGASRIACIVNAETDRVREYLHDTPWPVPIDVLQRTTASSAESFLALRPFLSKAPFLLTTVDAICAPSALVALAARGRALSPTASVLGVTATVDDEKPLWAEVDADDRIRSLGDATRARHVTAGVYFLQPLVYSLADEIAPRVFTAFRAVLGALLTHGHPLYGFDVGAAIDVDRPEDIVAAERLLGLNV
ncbi:MAG: NTP transferase domain-containing protein [Deltaproteobacteria bacterium]|nr:NTP transferase domain-containing protein [Deltaproteobacteria bacterium]